MMPTHPQPAALPSKTPLSVNTHFVASRTLAVWLTVLLCTAATALLLTLIGIGVVSRNT